MAKRDKRREQIRNNPRHVRPEDLEALLLDAGFDKRAGKGDHVRFRKGQTQLTIDYRRPFLLPKYVLDAMKAIEKEFGDDENT